MALSGAAFAKGAVANLNLAYGAECAVDATAATPGGFRDVGGNLWQWCEDNIASLPDSLGPHPYYDDFTSPCYDGESRASAAGYSGGAFGAAGGVGQRWRARPGLHAPPRLRCDLLRRRAARAEQSMRPSPLFCIARRRAQRDPGRLLHVHRRRGLCVCGEQPASPQARPPAGSAGWRCRELERQRLSPRTQHSAPWLARDLHAGRRSRAQTLSCAAPPPPPLPRSASTSARTFSSTPASAWSRAPAPRRPAARTRRRRTVCARRPASMWLRASGCPQPS